MEERLGLIYEYYFRKRVSERQQQRGKGLETVALFGQQRGVVAPPARFFHDADNVVGNGAVGHDAQARIRLPEIVETDADVEDFFEDEVHIFLHRFVQIQTCNPVGGSGSHRFDVLDSRSKAFR